MCIEGIYLKEKDTEIKGRQIQAKEKLRLISEKVKFRAEKSTKDTSLYINTISIMKIKHS